MKKGLIMLIIFEWNLQTMKGILTGAIKKCFYNLIMEWYGDDEDYWTEQIKRWNDNEKFKDIKGN